MIAALGWYDGPGQGGDGNLILDKKDAIWKKLRLWIDEHCYRAPDVPCQSVPGELHKLESAGIRSLSVMYQGDVKIDTAGNEFRLFSVLNPDAEDRKVDERGQSCCDLHMKSSTDKRQIYDVYLATQPR